MQILAVLNCLRSAVTNLPRQGNSDNDRFKVSPSLKSSILILNLALERGILIFRIGSMTTSAVARSILMRCLAATAFLLLSFVQCIANA